MGNQLGSATTNTPRALSCNQHPLCLSSPSPSPALQVCLSTSAKPGAKAALRVRVGEGAPLLVCSLREGATESTGVDLIFDQ